MTRVIYCLLSATLNLLISFWQSTEVFLGVYLDQLDPSLFQNVILGLLALLVPIGVGILSFYFEERSKEKVESNLELFILLKRVLQAKKIVFYSVLVLFLFTLYKFNFFIQVFTLLSFLIYIIWLIGGPLRNIWKWLLENNENFGLDFLRSLNVKKDSRVMITSWKALWLGKNNNRNESGFTKIFISHISEAIKKKKYGLVIELSKAYLSNIENRNLFSVSQEILPKVLEWNEILWNEEQYWLTSYALEKKVENIFSHKYFLPFRKWGLNFIRRIYKEKDYFWNWSYFDREFLPSILKVSLNDGHAPFEFFRTLKNHLDESEVKLDKITDGDKKERYWNYMKGLLGNFCIAFFENINSAPNKFDIWEHCFPKEWKITMENSSMKIPRILSYEFERWASARIFEKRESGFDDKLSEVAGGLFPSVHSGLFPAFLVLLYSSEIEYAIEREFNVFLVNGILSWSGNKTDKEINEMRDTQETSRKDETIKIIYSYFQYWNPIKLYKEDMTDEENSGWKEYSEYERKKIIKRVRRQKLQKIADELRSEKIITICKAYKEKEYRRVRFLELINLLIEGVENNI